MSAGIDPDEFRSVLGLFPTSVVAVTAVDRDDRPTGMTVGSFTSVSLDPLMISFCSAFTSMTFPKIRSASAFCVNLLAHDQDWICRQLATRGDDKFRGIKWHPAPSGAPIIEDVLAWIDCTFADVIEAGDHFLVLGAVQALDAVTGKEPLVFLRAHLNVCRSLDVMRDGFETNRRP